MDIRFFKFLLLGSLITLGGCSHSSKEPSLLSEQQLKSIERLSSLEQDLSNLLTLLESQASVDNIQATSNPDVEIKRYSASKQKANQTTGIQLKLFPLSINSMPQVEQHQALLAAVKRKFPSIFSEAEFRIQAFEMRDWATVSGLRSTQEAKIYCRLFSIQSIDCRRLML
ncbi:hypothetical protein CWB89_15150 [Pseudoalteromonas piscicida]|uniref:Lipoprotein n=1 Tax=Pseudoalteromonas piscicida TaxID=43662 RepID=A0AAQ2ERG0_PSEO7|nr:MULTISPECIES: hypothetical protein [Pseudoalteromonas]KJY86255.1 hypothetical protein TW75_17860 [Pseudoalteromonas piscicida]MDP4488615.1 hypothetical protein [Pseudoalteromonas piscicida]TMN34856.1 hypothetical protein CWB95_20015 [Pseudoalteromonas piscicida]TMN41060.1 hypothetical protein CWB94_08555 [Pseudoalteromonas piscicida]TMN46805.1 hypothetical protein CWB91_22630 [Pseudoalteromonas piscicida]